MKKIILSLLATITLGYTHAQSYSGTIAHWNMDSSARDISGGGHHGSAIDVVPDFGRDGIFGHAYRFNGVTSKITVPYSSAFNLSTAFTICAVVKPLGFYSGPCQGSNIFQRGKTGRGVGTYYMYMGDWPHDYDCRALDTTVVCFAGTHEGISYFASGTQDYSPHVALGNWYKVVFTSNDTFYKTYVNGTLVATAELPAPGVPLGSSTDGISIGYNIFEDAAGYPYQFNGLIDDVMLINRVLSDSEIRAYHPSTTTSIETAITEDKISIYPNPSNGIITVAVPIEFATATVEVYNMIGQRIAQKSADALTQFDLSAYPRGVYSVNISHYGVTIHKRIVID